MTLSIIIPVYNVEDYLSDCLESILRCDLADCEIILVLRDGQVVHLTAHEMDDVRISGYHLHLAPKALRHREGVDAVVVLVVAINEERGPRLALVPLQNLLVARIARPQGAKVAANDEDVAAREALSFGPRPFFDLEAIAISMGVSSNKDQGELLPAEFMLPPSHAFHAEL